MGDVKMNLENEPVASDLHKTPIVFKFKETPAEKCIKKACPTCKSTRIYHKKSKGSKMKGRGRIAYSPSVYHCYACKSDFVQPISVEGTKCHIRGVP